MGLVRVVKSHIFSRRPHRGAPGYLLRVNLSGGAPEYIFSQVRRRALHDGAPCTILGLVVEDEGAHMVMDTTPDTMTVRPLTTDELRSLLRGRS